MTPMQKQMYHDKIVKLTKELELSRVTFAAAPTPQRAIEIQRIQKQRAQLQRRIKPTLATVNIT
jgi:hypothetical protein